MPLLVVWGGLGTVMLGFALYATLQELRTPRDPKLAGGSPLNAQAGQGFLPRPGIRASDGPTRRVGKCLVCLGWYVLAIALLGIAIAGLSGSREPPWLSVTTVAGSTAIVLLLLGGLLRVLGARTGQGER